MKYAISIILASLFTFPSWACSFVGYDLYQPTLEQWDMHPGPKQVNENAKGTYWESMPLAVVENIQINRANYEGNSSCKDTGVISFLVKLPTTSTYNLGEFGVYLQVVDGDLPNGIFPNLPITARVENESMAFTFPWLDVHPSDQIPLDLSVEIRFVSHGLNLGLATKFKIEQMDD